MLNVSHLSQPVRIYQSTQSLKSEVLEFRVLFLYLLPNIQWITESPSARLPSSLTRLLLTGPSSQPLLLSPLLLPFISSSMTRVSFLKCPSHCVSLMLKICLSLAFCCFLNKVWALARFSQWLECQFAEWRVAGSIPSKSHVPWLQVWSLAPVGMHAGSN